MPDHHAPIRKDAFANYLRGRFSPAGYDVSEVADAPYKELVKHQPEGFSFGLSIGRDGSVNPGDKARVGVWFRSAGKGGIAELSALRNHYQVKLQQQGRGCCIHSCAPSVGTFCLYEYRAGHGCRICLAVHCPALGRDIECRRIRFVHCSSRYASYGSARVP
jgi:hypothetical protein